MTEHKSAKATPPRGPRALGIVSLILGAGGAIWAAIFVMMAFFVLRKPASAPEFKSALASLTDATTSLNSSMVAGLLLGAALALFLGLTLLPVGIGLLRHRRWARGGAVAWGAVAVACEASAIAWLVWLVGSPQVGIVIMPCILGALATAFAVVLFVALRRPQIREAMTR